MLLKESLTGLPVEIRSAGTHANDGQPMPEEQLVIAQQLGINLATQHKATRLTAQELHNVHLVLAMGRDHRSAVVKLQPQTIRKTFTIRELARIIQITPSPDQNTAHSASPTAKFEQAIETLASNRGLAIPPTDPIDDDVIDPYKQNNEIYRKSRDQLLSAVETVSTYLKWSMT